METNQKLSDFTDKNSVVRFEFKNLSYVVLWSSKSKKGERTEFWHATMNSALILKYMIGSSARLHFTQDFYMHNLLRLYICYTNKKMPLVIECMNKRGHQTVRKDDDFVIFKLANSVEPEKIKEWKKTAELVQQKIDELYKANRNPQHLALYDMMRKLGDELRVTNRKMNGADREIFGVAMIKSLVRAYQEYHNFSVSDTDKDIAEEKRFIGHIDDMSFLVDVCGIKRTISEKQLLKMGKLFDDIRKYFMSTGKKA